jgi:hypothetical protein
MATAKKKFNEQNFRFSSIHFDNRQHIKVDGKLTAA